MNLWQFLHDATFWQWLGLIVLAACLASWRPITVRRCKHRGATAAQKEQGNGK